MKRFRMPDMALALIIVAALLVVFEGHSYGNVTFRVLHFGQLVDNESGSADCLSCHDAMIAKGVGFQIWRHTSSTNPLGNHPIEVTYPSDWSGKKGFSSQSDIGKSGLRLLEGKVTCITCHDLRLDKRRYFLPVPMKGSALCFVCHQK